MLAVGLMSTKGADASEDFVDADGFVAFRAMGCCSLLVSPATTALYLSSQPNDGLHKLMFLFLIVLSKWQRIMNGPPGYSNPQKMQTARIPLRTPTLFSRTVLYSRAVPLSSEMGVALWSCEGILPTEVASSSSSSSMDRSISS